MTAQAGCGLKHDVGEAVRLIDSPGGRLAASGWSGLGAEWARFSARVCGAKLHGATRLDAALGRGVVGAGMR